MSLASLAHAPRWVGWRNEKRGDDITKVPYDPRNGRRAKSDDPTTWGTQAEALEWAARNINGGGGGVGLVLGDLGDGKVLAGIDLDTCRAPDGAIEPWASDVLRMLDTYAEVSPSGTGVKAFFAVDTSALSALRTAMGTSYGRAWKHGTGKHQPAIELHTGNRYFAVTGKRLPDMPTEIRHVPLNTILHLIRRVGPAFAQQGDEGDRPAKGGGPEEPRGGGDDHSRGGGGADDSSATPHANLGEQADDRGSGGPDDATAGGRRNTGAAAGRANWAGNAAEADLRERIEAACKTNLVLAQRWRGDWTGLSDSSDSAKAMSLGSALKRAGFSFDDMSAALRMHPDTREWARTKGAAAGNRELKRIWAKAAKGGASPAAANGASAQKEPPSFARLDRAVAQARSALAASRRGTPNAATAHTGDAAVLNGTAPSSAAESARGNRAGGDASAAATGAEPPEEGDPYDAAPEATGDPSSSGGDPNSAPPPGKNSNPKSGRQFRSRVDDLRPWTLEALFELPPPEWLIPDILARDTLAVLYAPWKNFKSFIALDMALCLATGTPWQDKPVIQSKVLYLVAEGVRGIRARSEAWLQHHNHAIAEIQDHFRVVRVPVNLMSPADVGVFVDVIHDEGARSGFRPDLVILDTLARCMPGGDESSTRDMNTVVSHADQVRHHLDGICMLLVHHPGKDLGKGMRGSSSLPGATDTILVPKRNGMQVSLLLDKQKDGEDGLWFYFRAERVELPPLPGCTEPRSSLVMIHDTSTNAPPSGPKTRGGTSGTKAGQAASSPPGGISSQTRRALDILKALIASEGQPLPATPGFPPGLCGILESRWREECNTLRISTGDSEGAGRKAFARAFEQLLDAGRVTAREAWVWST